MIQELGLEIKKLTNCLQSRVVHYQTKSIKRTASTQTKNNKFLYNYRGLSVKKDQLYYVFFNNDGELITQKFGVPKS